MKKPKILYHASTNKHLTRLEPQRTLSKDKYIGNFVFATSNWLYALMYLAPNAAGTKLMEAEGEYPYIVINGSVERYKELDRGGAIYMVPAESFVATPQAGLEDSERVSTNTVTPLSKDVFESSLKAIIDASINVYFLNDDDFRRVMAAKDNAWKILSQLEPER